MWFQSWKLYKTYIQKSHRCSLNPSHVTAFLLVFQFPLFQFTPIGNDLMCFWFIHPVSFIKISRHMRSFFFLRSPTPGENPMSEFSDPTCFTMQASPHQTWVQTAHWGLGREVHSGFRSAIPIMPFPMSAFPPLALSFPGILSEASWWDGGGHLADTCPLWLTAPYCSTSSPPPSLPPGVHNTAGTFCSGLRQQWGDPTSVLTHLTRPVRPSMEESGTHGRIGASFGVRLLLIPSQEVPTAWLAWGLWL